MALQSPLDVREPDAGAAAEAQHISCCALVSVRNDQRELPTTFAHSVQSSAHRHLASELLLRDAVFDRVFDERLKNQRREPYIAEARRDVNRDMEALLEARELDVQI